MAKNKTKNKVVLVGVLKEKRDFDILLNENWYRIPVIYSPRLRFSYLAFYQPAIFGYQGKCIQYYARVLYCQTDKRGNLLPNELNHPRANDYYFKIKVGKIKKLSRPIKNIVPRRVSFGFTTLSHLFKSKNLLQLYGVNPTEQIVEEGLKRAGIKAISQYYILCSGKRFCLDFAVFCKKGAIAVECDNKKAHTSLRQKKKDEIKDNLLRRCGWTIIRLAEQDIVFSLKSCIAEIQKATQKLGGFKFN